MKVSKLEALREGNVVDFDGRKVRLNPESQSLEYSDGEIKFVGDDPRLFPKSELDEKTLQQQSRLKREIKNYPLGEGVGETLFQASQGGSITRGAGDWADYFTSKGDDLIAKRRAKIGVSEDISQKKPIKSAVSTGLGFIPDILATQGLSGAQAGGALTLAGSGSRVTEDPESVLGNVALGAGGGWLFDKGANFLNNIASRRKLARQIPQEAEAVAARNLEGAAEVEARNLAEKQRFLKDKEFADRQNLAMRHQANLEALERENQLIEAKNAYEQAKAARSAETANLKTQYEQAQNQYKTALQQLPERQAAAQKAISERASKYYDSVAEMFPENNVLSTENLGAQEYLDQTIRKTALATTKEGREAERVINSLFKEGELMNGKQLANRLRELDKVIERSSPEVKNLLDGFKRTLGKEIPKQIEDGVFYSTLVPKFEKNIEKETSNLIGNFDFKVKPTVKNKVLIDRANKNLKDAIKEMSPEEFLQKMQSGELSEELAKKSLPIEDYVKGSFKSKMKKGSVKGFAEEDLKKQGLQLVDPVSQQMEQYEKLVSEMANRIEDTFTSIELQSQQAARKARQTTARRFRETYGVAEPISPPSPPTAPDTLPDIAPPAISPKTAPPSSMPSPTAPIAESYQPEVAPTLPPVSGLAEGLGDFLEKPVREVVTGGNRGIKGLASLAGLKYLLGSAAAPIEAGYAALKTVTMPNALGEGLRRTFREGGIEAISNWASKYPSYDENGIVQDPRERRSLVREIEDDQTMPLEVKAVMQSKVNRGKPLTQKMQ